MQKIFIYIFLFCFMWTAVRCQSAQQVRRIEYTTLTRGFHKQVIITPDSVISITEGRGTQHDKTGRKLNSGEWEQLKQRLHGVKLTDMPTLESPTSKRAYDGARHSTINITDNQGQAWQHSFDDEDPHAKLKPLLEALLQIGKSQ